MTISFILNGEDVSIQKDAGERLVNILRDSFNLTETKSGCLKGCCGSCLVFLNNLLVPSCMIPAFRLRGSEVVTIEGFETTEEYQDIAEGFKEGGVKTCLHCRAGKILCTEALLSRNNRPDKETIEEAFSCINCSCTEPRSLVRGVLAAAERRRSRIYARALS
jgi:carbon-monoxide dehydrogenase small subunit